MEISQQVQHMGQIYRDTEEALIWVGDIHSRAQTSGAVRLLEDIISIFENWYDLNHETTLQEELEIRSKRVEKTPDSEDQKEFWDWLKEEKCKEWLD